MYFPLNKTKMIKECFEIEYLYLKKQICTGLKIHYSAGKTTVKHSFFFTKADIQNKNKTFKYSINVILILHRIIMLFLLDNVFCEMYSMLFAHDVLCM